MTQDLKVMYVRNSTPVDQADFDWSTRTLILGGKDFRTASSVIVNGAEVTEFTIVTANRIELVLPKGLRNQRIRTIDVVSESFTSTIFNFLEFRLGAMPQWTSGLHKLVQQYTKLLLTTPGSNLFRTNEGGGIQQVVGAPIKDSTGKAVISRVIQGARLVEKQIRRSQTSRALPAEERLKEATILDVRYTPETTGVQLRIRLESEAGQLAVYNMGVSNTPST